MLSITSTSIGQEGSKTLEIIHVHTYYFKERSLENNSVYR